MTLETLAGGTSQSSQGRQDYNSHLQDGVGGVHNRVGSEDITRWRLNGTQFKGDCIIR